MSAPINPDCRVGKHRACAGDAWDDASDTPTSCACPCHGEHDHVCDFRLCDTHMTCSLCGVIEPIETPEDTTLTEHTCRVIDLTLNAAGTALVCPHGYQVDIPGEIILNGQRYQAGAPTPTGRVPAINLGLKVTGL